MRKNLWFIFYKTNIIFFSFNVYRILQRFELFVSLVEVGGDCVYTMEVVLSAYIDKKIYKKNQGSICDFFDKGREKYKNFKKHIKRIREV